MQSIHHIIYIVLLVSISFGEWSNAKSTCDLPCTNGGICKQRRQLMGNQTTFEYTSTNRLDQEVNQRQYCQCPTGYVGSFCEIKLVLCKDGNETCSNGNACKRGVDDYNVEYYHCECDTIQSDLSLPYAAKFCEHESTVFCINEIDAKNIKKNRQSLGGASRSSFCINGGKCKDTTLENGSHRSSCDCPEGYSGLHCEVSNNPQVKTKKSSLQIPTRTSTSTTSPYHIILVIFVFFVCFFSIIAISLTLLVWYGNRNRIPRRPKTAQERAKIPKHSEHTETTEDA